jgi:acyl carrier protein
MNRDATVSESLTGEAATTSGARNALRLGFRLMAQEFSKFTGMTNAQSRIVAIASHLLVKRGIHAVPTRHDNLREAGLLSMDMVNLMLAVEAEFGIDIPQSAMTPENFDTVAAVESLVSVTLKAA